MAVLLRAPTIFQLLNDLGLGLGSQEFSICQRGDDMISQDMQEIRNIIQRSSPTGTTPLVRHIRELRTFVLEMKSFPVNEDKKIGSIIATDFLRQERVHMCP